MSYEESKFFLKFRRHLISESLFVAISTFDWCIVDAKNDFLYRCLNKYFTYLGPQHHFCPLVWHNVLWCDFHKITKKMLLFLTSFFLSLSHLLRRRWGTYRHIQYRCTYIVRCLNCSNNAWSKSEILVFSCKASSLWWRAL